MNHLLTRRGFNLHSKQHSDPDSHLGKEQYETVIIPASSLPTFGAYFTIDYREINVEIKKLILQFNISAISGMTSGMFSPSQFLVNHIDIVQSNNIITTIYPEEQFIQQQLFECDEDRLLQNIASGLYSSTALRTTMATTGSFYYLPLWDYFKTIGNLPIFDQNQSLQLRVFMNPLANCTTGTGTAVATILSCNLLAKVRRIHPTESDALKLIVKTKPLHYRFNELKYQSFTVQSGVSTATLTLTNLVGNINLIFFIVRPSSSLIGNAQFNFTAITQYEYLNSAGSNMTGGQPINNSEALLVLGNDICLSSYLVETALYTVNNGANVYAYTFSKDIINDMIGGQDAGFKPFFGSEQLKITFASVLGATHQVDVYAYNSAVLQIDKNGIKKMNYCV